jgi:tRNA(fMet)-specific endonuclease VapC
LTTRYLLDTNVLSELMRHPNGQIAEQIEQTGAAQVCTSIVVVAELRYGVAKSRSRRLAIQLAAILDGLDVLRFQAPADAVYGELRSELERNGTPIGANDMLIAAHALALDLTLVTANEREFSRVRNLRIENWLR